MAVVLSATAAEEIKRIVEQQKLDGNTVLRMGISGGGCHGLQYSLAFDNQYDPATDARYEHHGVALVARKKFALHLDGTQIDYADGPMGRGFSIEYPNYPRGGGCAGCGHH
jgi:iron-sulfur cluster assembly protein